VCFADTARVLDLLHDHQVVARQVVLNTLQCEMLDHRREQTRDVVLVESQRVRHLLLAEVVRYLHLDGGVLEVSVEGLRGGRGHGLDLLQQLLRGDPGGVWVHRLGKGLHGRLLLVCRPPRLDVQDVDCFLVLLSLLPICISIVLLSLSSSSWRAEASFARRSCTLSSLAERIFLTLLRRRLLGWILGHFSLRRNHRRRRGVLLSGFRRRVFIRHAF